MKQVVKVLCDYLQHDDRVYPKGDILELPQTVADNHAANLAVQILREGKPVETTVNRTPETVSVAASRVSRSTHSKPKR